MSLDVDSKKMIYGHLATNHKYPHGQEWFVACNIEDYKYYDHKESVVPDGYIRVISGNCGEFQESVYWNILSERLSDVSPIFAKWINKNSDLKYIGFSSGTSNGFVDY